VAGALRNAGANTGSIEEESRVMEDQGRLCALVVVQCLASESIAAPAGREVVQRPLQAVAAKEPLKGPDRAESVLRLARDGEGAQLGFDERGGVKGLLVASAWRSVASSAPAVTRKPGQV
jgi:hypothetical protein